MSDNSCGCCAGLTAATPGIIANRPGLSAIAYRVGTYSLFKRSMLSALSDARRPALLPLKTREDDDFSLALLDATATLADILTLYQERIANESYLRTATERRSLLELARLIGYELRPGVAANAVLAFTLEEAPGSPRKTTIDRGVKVQSIPGPDEKPQIFETIEKIEARVEWNALKPRFSEPQTFASPATQLFLKGTDTQLQAGDAIVIVDNERETNPDSARWAFRFLQTVTTNHDQGFTEVTWKDPLPSVLLSSQPAEQYLKVFALRLRTAMFGHNAPAWQTMPVSVKQAYRTGVTDDPTTWGSEWPDFRIQDNQLDLDAVYPKIMPGSWVVLTKPNYVQVFKVNGVTSVSRAQFALSAKITRIDPDRILGLLPLRNATVFAQSEELTLAERPLTAPVTGATVTLAAPPEGLVKDQLLVSSGKDGVTGKTLSEVVKLADVNLATITLSPPLAGSYDRDSFSLNANVARATHGETAREILGAGDASQAYQKFVLRQSPLTFTSAATPTGGETTLQVRVNDVLWHEAPTLLGRGPQEHIYITRIGDDGKVTVEFGDGVTGARLPTGQDNVRATYRKGIGVEGLVKAGQLTLLMTKPLGVKSVTNPEDAADAKDPDTLADARRNAPLTVLTLDRTVSLQDYEDFARAFGAVAKALATWNWDGEKRSVFITIAGANGAPISESSDTYEDLLDALRKAGDPFVSLRVKSYQPASFRVAGKVKPDPDYLPEKVLGAVKDAMLAQFSFDARSFAQPVMRSEVIAAMQAVEGVVALDLDKLYRGTTPDLQNRLLAVPPQAGPGGEMLGAELLTIDPASLDQLVIMS
ncbi:MAG: putative baseplate assembly protein [Terriglobia bacterium]